MPVVVLENDVSVALDISFIIPCYNEEKRVTNAIRYLEGALAQRPDLTYQIIVIDDASTDNTSEVIKKYLQEQPTCPLSLYRNAKNEGLGYTYLSGASLALGTYYMYIPGDGDTRTENILKILENLGKADMVIPYLKSMRGRPLSRQIISRVFTILINILSGNHVRYYNGQVVHKRECVLKMNPEVAGFGYQAELICEGLRRGFSFVEVETGCDYWPKKKSSAFTARNIDSIFSTLSRILWKRILYNFNFSETSSKYQFKE